MISLISIHKNDLLNRKIEIYYETMNVITKGKYNHKLINIIN